MFSRVRFAVGPKGTVQQLMGRPVVPQMRVSGSTGEVYASAGCHTEKTVKVRTRYTALTGGCKRRIGLSLSPTAPTISTDRVKVPTSFSFQRLLRRSVRIWTNSKGFEIRRGVRNIDTPFRPAELLYRTELWRSQWSKPASAIRATTASD